MRTLLIDNYDSYTYNLFQLIAEVYGELPRVLANDAPEWNDLRLHDFDAIVISPGPGSPSVARDSGVGLEVLRTTTLPVLGVCFGHQLIAYACGATVGRAATPRHGYLEQVSHIDSDLFLGLPQDFTAVRYHSLAVRAPLPAALQATAWAQDGTIMGLRHRSRPLRGVQFHPESIASDHGALLLENFRSQCARRDDA